MSKHPIYFLDIFKKWKNLKPKLKWFFNTGDIKNQKETLIYY